MNANSERADLVDNAVAAVADVIAAARCASSLRVLSPKMQQEVISLINCYAKISKDNIKGFPDFQVNALLVLAQEHKRMFDAPAPLRLKILVIAVAAIETLTFLFPHLTDMDDNTSLVDKAFDAVQAVANTEIKIRNKTRGKMAGCLISYYKKISKKDIKELSDCQIRALTLLAQSHKEMLDTHSLLTNDSLKIAIVAIQILVYPLHILTTDCVGIFLDNIEKYISGYREMEGNEP